MLEDREYMHQKRGFREDMGSSGMKCLFILILVNIFVFIIGTGPVLEQLILPTDVLSTFQLWRFITAAFAHAGFMHLFFNMFGLFMFGSLSAPVLGGKKFFGLYLTAALTGNILWFLLNMQNPEAAVLGASGAVVGVIMATAMMMPDMQVLLLFFPVPIKLKTMAIVYIILEVFMAQRGGSGIAYLAHVGGFFGGWLFMELFAKQQITWHPLGFLRTRRRPSVSPRNDEYRRGEPPQGWTSASYDAYTSGPVSKREIDRVLDKLSRSGINSLSEQEMETLRKAREQMKSGQTSR